MKNKTQFWQTTTMMLLGVLFLSITYVIEQSRDVKASADISLQCRQPLQSSGCQSLSDGRIVEVTPSGDIIREYKEIGECGAHE